MTESEQDKLREWIKANLVIEVEQNPFGNDSYVSLRLVGDDKPFSQAFIYIPDDAP